MKIRPTPEESKRMMDQCHRQVENAKHTWKHNNTTDARDKYYEACRYRDLQANWYVYGILPLGKDPA